MQKQKSQQKEKMTLRGVYKFTKAFLEKKEHFELNDEIQRRKDAGMPFMDIVRKLNRMCRTEVVVVENLLPTVGRTMIADNITNSSPDNTPRVTHVALGTGTNAPANGDTTLQTETYRNAVASETNANNIAYITGFYTATEDNNTYREAGLFSDGAAGADTGILLSRVAINITKSNTETLTLDWTLTIS